MITDPLFYAAAIPAVTLLGLAKGGFSGLGLLSLPLMALVTSPVQAAAITLPILIMAGAASPLGDGPRSEALAGVVSSTDKTLLLYPEMMHEILNEPEHPQVLADLEAWLDARLPA